MHIFTCLAIFSSNVILHPSGSALPVHPDAVEDDVEADVEDEVGDANNPGKECYSSSHEDQGEEHDGVERRQEIAESNVCEEQFVFLNSNSMNFEAGKDDINC